MLKSRDILRLKKLNFHYFKRHYCATTLPPLNVPVIDTKNVTPRVIENLTNENNLKLTTLSNGLKVVSENAFGQFCTVGALIDAGSRYEIDYPSGISHMLEKLAFQSTENYHDNDAIVQKMEKLGGHVDCQAFKDCIVYAASAYKYNVEGAIDVLSDAMWRANLTEDEVDEQKQTVLFELEALEYKPDCEQKLNDLIHAAAFSGNTLGLPKLCPEENLSEINSKLIKHYIHRYYRPNRITIAGVNVDHDELVRYAEKYFVDSAPSWISESVVDADQSMAQYTGGLLTDHRDEPRLQPGITQLPELVHIAIGFESANYTDPDMFSFAVLNMLLGGGGSFSAGGPGKGMYSRLYINVLNRYHWMFSSTAYNHSYADSGLFCIHSSAPPRDAKSIVHTITEEFMNLISEPFHSVEVSRAKKQTQSMLMMNLESRVVKFEDIGRQILGLGFRKTPKELFDSIEAVTTDDLKRISQKMLITKPSVAAIGNLKHLPDYSEVEKSLFKKSRSFGSYIFGR